jgi:hypothetical protein
MECKYHSILESLHQVVWERIDSHYDWDLFWFWLGDESNLAELYTETFEEVLESQLTEEQNTLLKKKGENLEKMIFKWNDKWKNNNPDLQNQKLPKSCLKIKIYEYILYQLNKGDIRGIIGNPC